MLSRLGRHCLVVSLSRFYHLRYILQVLNCLFFWFFFFILFFCFTILSWFCHNILTSVRFIHLFGCTGSSLPMAGWCVGFSWWWLLWRSTGSTVGFSGCSAQELWYTGLVAPRHGMFQEPGIEPVFPALAGRFLTTGLPGKSVFHTLNLPFSN